MFSCDIKRIQGIEHLCAFQIDWERLAAYPHHSAFLNWPWIQAWVGQLPDTVHLHIIYLTQDDEIVAMGLLTEQNYRQYLTTKIKKP